MAVLQGWLSVLPRAMFSMSRLIYSNVMSAGALANRRIGALSGGERFRVALAALLLAEPAHQLVVLDEPTNNLDLDTARALVEALDAYRGGLLVVSHDRAFLRRLRLTRVLALDADGGLTDRDEP